MTSQFEIERDKAVVDAFYQAGIEGHLTSFARYLDPDFEVTAPNYLPWGGTYFGAAFFRDEILPYLPDVFDFARFSYDSVIAEPRANLEEEERHYQRLQAVGAIDVAEHFHHRVIRSCAGGKHQVVGDVERQEDDHEGERRHAVGDAQRHWNNAQRPSLARRCRTAAAARAQMPSTRPRATSSGTGSCSM